MRRPLHPIMLLLMTVTAGAQEPLSATDKLTAVLALQATSSLCGITLAGTDQVRLTAARSMLAARAGQTEAAIAGQITELTSELLPLKETLCPALADPAELDRNISAAVKLAETPEPSMGFRQHLQALYFYEMAYEACDLEQTSDQLEDLARAQKAAQSRSGIPQSEADEIYAATAALIAQARDSICDPEGPFMRDHDAQLADLLKDPGNTGGSKP